MFSVGVKYHKWFLTNLNFYENVSYRVLDAAEHRCGQYPCEEGHKVEAGEGPDQNVDGENFLAASYSNKLIVVAEVASTAEKTTALFIIMFFKLLEEKMNKWQDYACEFGDSSSGGWVHLNWDDMAVALSHLAQLYRSQQ